MKKPLPDVRSTLSTLVRDDIADPEPEASETTLNVRAYTVLRQRLLSGQYAPGALLNTRPLAVEFGMSPMPVREALARLRSDGALEALANRAFRVPVLRESVFRELLVMRLRLEACACERAAILASSDAIRAVAGFYDALLAASQEALDTYLEAHRRFHFAIYDLAGMPLLRSFIEGLWLRMGPLLRASSQGRIQVDHAHHGSMVKALSASDPVALVSALRDDLTDGIEPITAYLRDLPV